MSRTNKIIREEMEREDGVLDYVARLRNNGYVIIEDLVPEIMIEQVNQELKPSFHQTPNSEGLFWGFHTKRMGRIFSKAPTSHGLATNPVILGIMEDILGPNCEKIQVNLTQAIRIEPGEEGQLLHRDDEMFPWGHPGSEFMINAMWALDDFTAENGGTVLWPRSHLKPVQREVPPEELVQAEMKRGSVLIWLGSTQHGGGANRSRKPRTGLTVSYSLGWLRQAENQYLAYPPEVAKHFPEKLQELIGYKVHRPNLGWYEGQEPDVLFNGRPEALPALDLVPRDIELMIQEYLAGKQVA
ncbi:phytanoyl-CoA dioxygenase family protein [Emcibacter sp.]|uniref:phytanoyl-CoA dioxygenase family protein n=1 Tax=Emcibacter sp. TaxID=1979954 RepID=UPI002AA87EEF|nr:phytanoyl-CoA dioxygenase family protein [Emcibacter sp.]